MTSANLAPCVGAAAVAAPRKRVRFAGAPVKSYKEESGSEDEGAAAGSGSDSGAQGWWWVGSWGAAHAYGDCGSGSGRGCAHLWGLWQRQAKWPRGCASCVQRQVALPVAVHAAGAAGAGQQETGGASRSEAGGLRACTTL